MLCRNLSCVPQLRDVSIEYTTFGNYQGVGLNVSGDPARGGDLNVPRGHHIAFINPLDQGVHRVDIGSNDPLVPNDQSPLDIDLSRYLALDLYRIPYSKFSFKAGRLTQDRKQRASLSCAVPLFVSEYKRLLLNNSYRPSSRPHLAQDASHMLGRGCTQAPISHEKGLSRRLYFIPTRN